MVRKGIKLLLMLICLASVANAQHLLDYKLSSWYLGTLDKVLDKISAEANVKIEFDRERMKEIYVDHHPIKQPLKEFLEVVVCKNNKLKYYISNAGAVVIIDRWTVQNEQRLDENEKYKGKPTRFKFSLTGRIIDVASVEPLPFVNIAIRGTSMGANTNADGYFTFPRIPSDTVALLISAVGYKPKLIHLSPNTPLENLIVKMEVNAVSLKEVVVNGDKKDVLQTNSKVGMIKMSPIKLYTLPSLGEKDIFRSFQLMPGISAANENSSGLYVRGGTPDQSLVVYDGFTVYNVEHLFGFFSSFNSNAIKDIQLYKGGFDAKYGGRISSVVEITGKEGNKKEFGGFADVSLMSANAFIEFPIGEKFTFIAAGRRSWESPLYDKIFKKYSNSSSSSAPTAPSGKRFGENDIASYFYDFNTKLTYRPTDKDIVWLSFYTGSDDLSNDITSGFKGMRPPGGGGDGFSNFSMSNIDKSNWGNLGVSLKWSRKWSQNFYGNFLVGYSNYFSNRDRSSSGSYLDSSGTSQAIKRGVMEYNHLDDYTAKADFEQKLNDLHTLEYGGSITYNKITYSYAQSDTAKLLDRQNSGMLTSLYLQDKLSFLDSKLRVTPGLRGNFYCVTSKIYLEPRLTSSYQLNERWKLKASVGRYYQFAKRVVREDIMAGSKDFWTLSDGKNLPITYSDQLILGASWENPMYLFDVEGYYKKISNLTEYSLRFSKSLAVGSFDPGNGGPNSGSVTYQDQFLTGKGRVQGIDFLLQKKQGDFTGWIGYTLGRVVNHINGYGNYDYYASNDVTHEFKAVATYHWRSWDFSGTWIYASGKPYTAPEGGYTITLLDGTKKSFVTVSTKNGMRLPNYHRLDLSATLNFKLGGRIPCTFGASIFNTYNRTNVWYKQFDIVENSIIETNVNYLGITPNINFSIKF